MTGSYDLNPDKVGAVDNFVTPSNNFGAMWERWSGVDIGLDLRLSGVFVRGGLTVGRTSHDNCEVGTKLPEMLGVRYGGSGPRAASRRSRPGRSASVTSSPTS